MPVIGLLLKPPNRPLCDIAARPISRAALDLQDEGIRVVFASDVQQGELVGHEATHAGWQAVRLRPDAVIDHYPGFSDPVGHQTRLHQLAAVPVANPPALVGLIRDKVRTQAVLQDLGMPALCTDPRRFAAFLDDGPAFVKPRYGSFGIGVRWIQGVPPPREGGQPVFLQRAVPPPAGFAGVSVRILVQRTLDGPVAYPAVARVSDSDPVVNRARGADVIAAHRRFPLAAERSRILALAVLDRFPGAIELGVDAVVDPDQGVHLIEVNHRPRGRLAALALTDPGRVPAHERALREPFRWMAR